MGAIEHRRFSLLLVGIVAAALVWLIANPAQAHAGSWKTQGRSWGHHSSGKVHDHDYDYDDKFDDADCECSDVLDESDEQPVIEDECTDVTTPDDDVQGDDTSGEDDSDSDDEPSNPATEELELHINQQVKVGTGEFVDAENATTAPQGVVGDPVVWQVTVGVDRAPENEDRTVKITWEQPENVDVTTSQATSGSFNNGTWTVGIGDMPATLTINSTLKGTGLGDSTARITEISCGDMGAVGIAG